MTSPRWARALLGFLAPRHREDDVLGDLEETHRERVARRGRFLAWWLTGLDAIDMSCSVLVDRLRRRGPTPREPREASDEDVLTGLGVSWLDFKLGLRMLGRHPGLTLVATIAIAFAITLGAGTYEFFAKLTSPVMPFEDGDRIVELRNRDVRAGYTDRRALHDFVLWQEELRTVEELGAWHLFQRNLTTDRGQSVPRVGAAVTASLFALPRVPPALGRLLSEADEVPGAPMVVVLGHDVWRTQFGSDPEVVGRTVRLGSAPASVVGVMPEGFEWPRAYQLWTPMRLDVLEYERGESPSVFIAGRLAAGTSIEEARAELSAIGARSAADHPESHADLRPGVIRFGAIELPITGASRAMFYSLGALAFIALMVLVCGNVALLLFARTAAREGEIVVRSALGASRGRVVAQLFVEALILGGLATLLGLWGAKAGVGWVVGIMQSLGEGQLGFWFDAPLRPTTAAIAAASTLLTATIAGAVPALKVTGRRLGAHLQRVGSSSSLEFGSLWTAVIVTQIAVTVAFVPIILLLGVQTAQIRSPDYGFPAEQYLAIEVAMGGRTITAVEGFGDRSAGALDGDLESAARELRRRLLSEPEVRAVGVASQIPGPYHHWETIQLEGPTGESRSRRVQQAAVAPGFFDALGVPLVAGRDFSAADTPWTRADPLGGAAASAGRTHVAVVNEDFVRDLLEDRNAIGQRFRFRDPWATEETPDAWSPWHEIVGVVDQITMTVDPERSTQAGFYLPLSADANPVRLAARVGARPERLAGRVRELATEVDANLLVTDIRPLDDSAWQARRAYSAWFWVVLGGGGIGVLLATVGIYSIMSFTVSRRKREIGVRIALGADRRRVVSGIFARALRQISMGIAAGAVLILLLISYAAWDGGWRPGFTEATVFVAYLALMTAVCGLACVVPTARALAVEPTEALRAEG